MPKESKAIGRKDAMEAMCFRCKSFNLGEGANECTCELCPLYVHSPYAKTKVTYSPWTDIKLGKAVGFHCPKGVEEPDFLSAVTMLARWKWPDGNYPEAVARLIAPPAAAEDDRGW